FQSEEYALPEDTTQKALLELIGTLNAREDIDGILVQLPLPKGLDEEAVLMAISPSKDVDGFHPMNMGALLVGKKGFLPCTPAGIMEILSEYHIDPAGKQCVVVGRSNIVGKPMALLLLQKNGTVTVCHSKTRNLKEICLTADILVAAVGKVGLVTGDMVKPGAVVIDVAMNRNEAGKLCGDVVFDKVSETAAAITPVPGGVWPMTRAILMKNTLAAAKLHLGRE
ncbi:MAG: Methylenetetrahydrofolate dehydrogenase, partial [Evtepia sp.]|nr:Methylenetetrahydrofolate dehydrogenase [Evtepia sp.]